ncbi:MAG: oxalate:formate antiporter [Proteobacteria bacterium]|nr:oxalate:formate antiporter [Pseudomonadota bacterium]MDE3207669.1 oxalate:formate antiporter [Pseudomonadota bacterium]
MNKTSKLTLLLFWLVVLIPLAWGVFSTLGKAMALFK